MSSDQSETTPEQAIRAAWFARHPGVVGIAGAAVSACYSLGLSAEGASNLPGFQADVLRRWSEILADAANRMEPANAR